MSLQLFDRPESDRHRSVMRLIFNALTVHIINYCYPPLSLRGLMFLSCFGCRSSGSTGSLDGADRNEIIDASESFLSNMNAHLLIKLYCSTYNVLMFVGCVVDEKNSGSGS
ncbi:hypothetical protein GWI33_002628 [Rhynchophorus ferrugineus]|uniref:Uncharacterized protein n=1 Tax=Rhynchophorus ferrugineus TaxID=354439 RepID=A0A834IPC6_RHYFE|nr:hypothetical protein GWI33_002628 [Rhynchophorus ferrugineus]